MDATLRGSPRVLARPGRRRLTGLVLVIAASLFGIRGTQNAAANGDTRTITILHMHTKEETTVTFKQDGRYVPAALEKLNWALRDWRSDEPIRMDPRLFDVAWEVHRQLGSDQPFHVVSAYRSPNTNAMLRRRSRAVAKHSQHMLGKAMDFYLPDVPTARIREIGMRLQRGGVGFYPNAHTPFVHLDVGSVRSWPRMTRDQLVRLFPDQKTVHIPADGQPLAGYEMARAEIMAGGGSVGGYAVADADEGAVQASGRKSLWAMIFGGDEEEADARPAQRRGAPVQQPTVMAYAGRRDDSTSDNAGRFLISAAPEPTTRAVTRERSQRLAPQLQPQPQPAPEEAPASVAIAAAPPPEPQPQQPRRAQLIDAPLPMARPRELSAPFGIDGTQIAALPAGAGALAFAQTGPGGDQKLVLASLPPRRPDEMTGSIASSLAGPAMDAPLPPTRPVELAGASLAAVAMRAGESEAAAAPTGRLVAVNHPLPPSRPREAAAAAAAVTNPPPAAEESSSMDRNGLESLFSAVARPHGAASARPVTVATAKARPNAGGAVPIAGPSPAASLGFSQSDPADAKPGRFSGPAVRPLPTSFVQN